MSIPAPTRACRRELTSPDLERVEPSLQMKSGPGVLGRSAKYPSTALTGHRAESVAPRCKVVPIPKGSVLLLLRHTVRWDGQV